MTKLLLVRHGQTDWNVARRHQGQMDVPLNAEGERQAQELAVRLRQDCFDAIYSSDLQRSRQATEAQYLVMKYVFETLSYRRYEWKCDQLNQASCRAALRLGFQYEGTFRQALVYKGRNRDTAWFSLLDSEWPSRKDALESWLADSNFDEAGRQKTSLSKHQ